MYTEKEFKTIQNIKTHLISRNKGWTIDMLTLIEKRASRDSEYLGKFKTWINGSGGTVLLRDELCYPFKNSAAVTYYKNTKNIPFDNMWIALDTAILHAR